MAIGVHQGDMGSQLTLKLGPNSANSVRQKPFRRLPPRLKPVSEESRGDKSDFDHLPLEDISPDREVGVDEDPVDPFDDFVPDCSKRD